MTEPMSLDEVRAKRIELATARAQLVADAAAASAEAEERQALKDDEKRAAWDAKHGIGGYAEVPTALGSIFLTRPHQATFCKFRDQQSLRTDDLLSFVNPSVTAEDKVWFMGVLDQLPAVLGECANACAGLCGAKAESDAKKS